MSNPIIVITSVELDKLKQEARAIKKAESLSHQDALDRIAIRHGLPHWHAVTKIAAQWESTEEQLRRGVLVVVDVKEAQCIEPRGEPLDPFLEANGPEAWVVAHWIRNSTCESATEALPLIGRPLGDDDLEHASNFRFYWIDPAPESIEQADQLVRAITRWSPFLICFRGAWRSGGNNVMTNQDGTAIGFRV